MICGYSGSTTSRCFGALHEHNPVLVKRMREFEEQARVDEGTAIEYVRRLSWQGIPWVRKHLSADELTIIVPA